MLNFKPVSLDMKGLIDSYTFKFGEGSCQHSFVSSFCLAGKYGDMFCERDNFLYTLRAKKCSESERVYLFPHGESDNIKLAVQNILDDAHEHNSHVKFETLTRRASSIVCELFPGKFSVEGNSDLSEYVYTVDQQINLPGHELATKRKNIHKFFRDYEGHYDVKIIAHEHIELIRNFQREWLEAKILSEYDLQHEDQLKQENDGIQNALNNFFTLGLKGIILLIDGKIKGYAYGAPLSDKVFDAIAEKADNNIPNIYPVLKIEFAKLCCEGYEFLNREEDLGVEGLRTMKMRYQPAYMIEKFILTETEKS